MDSTDPDLDASTLLQQPCNCTPSYRQPSDGLERTYPVEPSEHTMGQVLLRYVAQKVHLLSRQKN